MVAFRLLQLISAYPFMRKMISASIYVYLRIVYMYLCLCVFLSAFLDKALVFFVFFLSGGECR